MISQEHLIEENRAAVGEFETALAHGDGTGESPAFVTEEFAFHDAARQRGAVDFHEGFSRPLAAGVDAVGHQLLADAALAADEHGGIAECDLFDGVIDRLHRPRVSDHVVRAEVLLDLLLEFLVFDAVVFDLFVRLLAELHGLGHELGDEREQAEVGLQLILARAAALNVESAHHLAAVGHGHADERHMVAGKADVGRALEFRGAQETTGEGHVRDDDGLAAFHYAARDIFLDAVHVRPDVAGREAAARLHHTFVGRAVENSQRPAVEREGLRHRAQGVVEHDRQIAALLERARHLEEDTQFLNDAADWIRQLLLEFQVCGRMAEIAAIGGAVEALVTGFRFPASPLIRCRHESR